MTSFVTFLFVGVVWLSNGSVEGPPVARTESSLADCMADIDGFEAAIEAANEGGSPVMRMTYHVECRPVMNTSEARPS